MLSSRRWAALAMIFTAAGCAPAMMGNPQADEAAIRSLTMDFQRAIVARDIDRIVAFHTPDAIVAPPNSPPVAGSAEIRQTWSGFLAANPTVTWEPARITIASSGDIATEVSRYQMSFDTPGGRVRDRGTFTTVWHKVGNEWRIASVTASSAMPMPPAGSIVVLFDTSAAEMLAPAGITWRPFAPVPGFPAGAQMAVIHGDPRRETDYVLRVRFPDGFRVPQHWHAKAEHVTVLSGEFNLGMGRDPNAPTAAHGPGAFLYMPPRTPHYAWTRGETILQLHGIGPFALNLGVPPS
jgi:ketosteroid isomerase-like protein/quercetin dioxygenase-like cupin family protein